MKTRITNFLAALREMRTFLILWATQTFSSLGSAMTGYALVLWSYEQQGSALVTALLMVSSYAPYVLCSIFAGALSDRWDKRRTMLVCDALAAATTVATLLLLRTGALRIWHLYVLNAINGLMNTVQKPASEVAASLLAPREYYQKTSGLRSFSSSLTTILTPVIASAVYAFGGMDVVIAIDLLTFLTAFAVLLFFINIPQPPAAEAAKEKLLASAKAGLKWLKQNPLILKLIFFLAWINLVASAFDAALPAYLLSVSNGGETVLDAVDKACTLENTGIGGREENDTAHIEHRADTAAGHQSRQRLSRGGKAQKRGAQERGKRHTLYQHGQHHGEDKAHQHGDLHPHLEKGQYHNDGQK